MKRFVIVLLAGPLAACTAPLESAPAASATLSPASAEPAELRATGVLDGEVIGVDRVPPEQALSGSLRLRLQTDAQKPVAVVLAPGWYLDKRGLHFSRSERVRVTAIKSGQTATLVATEVQKGEQRVPLRDAQGRPLWER